MRNLQNILDDIPYDSLPPAWTSFDLAAFSKTKRLWDYQQAALQRALRALWKYYEDLGDYTPGEPETTHAERKRRLMEWYRQNGLDEGLDLDLRNARRDITRLLKDYYPTTDSALAYEHLINRIGFWMATGSGKTLVIVKLLELLWRLIRLGEIPPYDILVLTCRDDLLAQLKAHVDEFNAAHDAPHIRLYELRDYAEVKRGAPSLFHESELIVFFYRSDNLSDEQKEKIVDFRNYDNGGRWYVLLDEAHKGDKADSKRQHIYSILSRNGFLFNFSATFTDPHDVRTTAYDFNLARFIEAGYGKHIAILTQELRAFRDEEDYTGAEKQKVVLKALLLLAYIRQVYEQIRHRDAESAEPSDTLRGLRVFAASFYHRPLLLTLVNSVNTKDADLKLFFHQLERIGKGEISPPLFEEAKVELWAELRQQPEYLFEDGVRFQPDQAVWDALTYADVLRLVYNAEGTGEMEALVRPSSRQELALKLKNADRPFALIKIGDITGWLKGELTGYQVNESFEDESYFERLNAEDSDIAILMGSRSFYEGWDSNRPNVITFINIGTGVDARKFILQSTGRGVRIEPLRGKRRRLLPLYNARDVDEATFAQLQDFAGPLESLFIFGTNRHALHTVIETMDQAQGKEDEHELSLTLNQEAVNAHLLLVPTYRDADNLLVWQRDPAKFPILGQELDLLQRYLAYLGDDRLLVSLHGARPQEIGLLHRVLSAPAQYFRDGDARRYGHLSVILPRLFGYFHLIPQEVEDLKPLAGEIRHFRHVKVLLKDIGPLQQKIEQVKAAPNLVQELRARYEAHQLAFADMLRQAQAVKESEAFKAHGYRLQIRWLAQHYYNPVLVAEDERIDYIRHIIRHPSEVSFLNDLEHYLQNGGTAFQPFDWWLFSKLDEALDEVYIPYYDPDANGVRYFYPDFVFWLQRGQEYFIVFVDPKGMAEAHYQHKVDGYRALFCDESTGKPRSFQYRDLRVQVRLRLVTEDANKAPSEYRPYWIDRVEEIAAL